MAEDITADIFLKAFDNLDKFQWRNRSSLVGSTQLQIKWWIIFATRTLCLWKILFRKYSDEENPEQLVVEKDLRKQWLDLIKTLSPAQQDVLLLRFQQGLKLKEIAAILSKNEGAIKALLFRGLKSLRKNIEEGGLEL